MTKIYSALAAVLLLAGAFAGGYFYRGEGEPKIKIVEKTKIEYRTIDRDYNAMVPDDWKKALACYDKSEPRLDGAVAGEWLKLSAGLCDRNWSRDIKIAEISSMNWKLIAGVGIAGAALGGYGIYKLMKR
jgi:hypothetical protein